MLFCQHIVTIIILVIGIVTIIVVVIVSIVTVTIIVIASIPVAMLWDPTFWMAKQQMNGLWTEALQAIIQTQNLVLSAGETCQALMQALAAALQTSQTWHQDSSLTTLS